ncbi:SMC-Scp complex subunit ScpB [Kribbella sp. NPDC055071]
MTDHPHPTLDPATPDATTSELPEAQPRPEPEQAASPQPSTETQQATQTQPEASPTDHTDPDAEAGDADTTPASQAQLTDDEPAEPSTSELPEHQLPAEADQAVEEGGVSGGELDEDHLPPGQTEVPVGDEVVIDDDTMRRALEAILMVTDEPLPVLTLARAVGRATGDVAAALGTLAEEYTEQGRGFDLREVGGGWRYYTRVEAATYVERFILDGQQARLTQAALETLSVVAYKQPVSRARVSAIRGVNVDGVMRTLIARGLVEEAGSDTESQATLYRTTSYFLERMGMQSLDDLPELAPYLPDMDDIEEELAAQALPPQPTPEDPSTTPPDEPAADESESPQEPSEPEPSAPNTDEAFTDDAAELDTGTDADLSTDDGLPAGGSDGADSAAGIDADLGADDEVAAGDSGGGGFGVGIDADLGVGDENAAGDSGDSDEDESDGGIDADVRTEGDAAELGALAVDDAGDGGSGAGIDGDLRVGERHGG